MTIMCNCDTFTGNININGGSLGIGAGTASGDSLAVGGAININGQTLRNAEAFTLCYGCSSYRWADNANDTAWMVLTTAGNLGIGIDVPMHRLDVSGDINTSGGLLASGRKVADGNGCYYS